MPNQSTITDDSEVQELHKQLHKLQKENEELREQLESIPTRDAFDITALETAKTKVLNKMKVGRQSSVGKALDAFVKQIKSSNTPNAQEDIGNLAVRLLLKLAYKRFKKHQRELSYFEDLKRILMLCGYTMFHGLPGGDKGYEITKDEPGKRNEAVYAAKHIGDIFNWIKQLSPSIEPME